MEIMINLTRPKKGEKSPAKIEIDLDVLEQLCDLFEQGYELRLVKPEVTKKILVSVETIIDKKEHTNEQN